MTKVVSRNKTAIRSDRGQAIAEGAVIGIFMTILSTLLLLLLLNTAILGGYDYKLRIVATEAARNIDSSRFWLGMPRDDYNEVSAKGNARVLADSLLDALGLPHTTTFEITTTDASVGGRIVPITRVDMSVNGLKTVGGFFPPFVELRACGVSCDSAVPPYATAVLTCIDPNNPNLGKAIEVPAYCAFNHNGYSYSPNASPFAHNPKGFTGATTRVFMNFQKYPQPYKIVRLNQGGSSEGPQTQMPF